MVAVLALTALLIAGGAAQSATGGSRAAKRADSPHLSARRQALAATGGTVTLFVHVKKNSAGKFVPKYIGAMFASGHR